MLYDVYIERAREPGRERELASAVGAAFGLPAERLAARIADGRVRVKSGADAEVARRLVAKLDEMGAVCAVVETGQTAGADAAPAMSAPPPPPPRAAPKPAQAAGAPLDPFAPPEMQEPPPELELADQATVPDSDLRAPPELVAGSAAPKHDAPPGIRPGAAGARLRWQDQLRTRAAGAIESSRANFAAGVAAAALAGLIAAFAVGAIRERGYEESFERVRAAADEVVDRESWRELERARADELEAMRGLRAGIVVTAGVAWLAVAGGLAFLWFRIIDWPAVARRLRPR